MHTFTTKQARSVRIITGERIVRILLEQNFVAFHVRLRVCGLKIGGEFSILCPVGIMAATSMIAKFEILYDAGFLFQCRPKIAPLHGLARDGQ